MANLRVITNNQADQAALTAVPNLVDTTPVENLQSYSRAKVIRTNSRASGPLDLPAGYSAACMEISADNKYLFIYDQITNTIYRYSTNYGEGISQATIDAGQSLSLIGIALAGRAIRIDPTGTQLIILDSADTFRYVTLATAWDLTSANYPGTGDFVMGVEMGACFAFAFSSSGHRIFAADQGVPGQILQYNLGTNYLPSSMSYSGNSITVGTDGIYPNMIDVTSDGTTIYASQAGARKVNQYTMNTAWDLSTATYTNKQFIYSGILTSNELSLTLSNNDERNWYMIDLAFDKIHHHSMSLEKDISTSTYVENPGTQEIRGLQLPVISVNAIVLGRHNFPSGTTLRIYLYEGQTWDSFDLLYDSGILTVTDTDAGSAAVGWGDFLWGTIAWGQDYLSDEFAPSRNYVHWITTGAISNVGCWKIVLDVPTTTELEVGRLFLGQYIEPTYNLSLDHKLSWEEHTTQYRTEGGTLRSDIATPVRKIEFELGTIHASDRPELQSGLRYVGMRKDFYISLFPEDTNQDRITDYSGIMKLTKVPVMQEFAPLYYKSKYVMEEV